MDIVNEMNERTVHLCVLCGKKFQGWGNNPEPLVAEGDDRRCCNKCNKTKVLPARILMLKMRGIL